MKSCNALQQFENIQWHLSHWTFQSCLLHWTERFVQTQIIYPEIPEVRTAEELAAIKYSWGSFTSYEKVDGTNIAAHWHEKFVHCWNFIELCHSKGFDFFYLRDGTFIDSSTRRCFCLNLQ